MPKKDPRNPAEPLPALRPAIQLACESLECQAEGCATDKPTPSAAASPQLAPASHVGPLETEGAGAGNQGFLLDLTESAAASASQREVAPNQQMTLAFRALESMAQSLPSAEGTQASEPSPGFMPSMRPAYESLRMSLRMTSKEGSATQSPAAAVFDGSVMPTLVPAMAPDPKCTTVGGRASTHCQITPAPAVSPLPPPQISLDPLNAQSMEVQVMNALPLVLGMALRHQGSPACNLATGQEQNGAISSP